MSGVVLSINDVTVRFGGVTACRGITAEVRSGELFAIMGPNGAGKTSLINAITGLYPMARGRVDYTDSNDQIHALAGRAPHRIAALGIVRTFQHLGLFPDMTVLENILLGRHMAFNSTTLSVGLRLKRWRREEIEQRWRAELLLERFGLQEVRNEYAGSLPYGLQKRAGLVRALALDPRVLLLDEPMAGMSLQERVDVSRIVLSLRHELQLTVVLIEHDAAMVMTLADRVLVLAHGERLALGSPDSVGKDPNVIKAYLGTTSED